MMTLCQRIAVLANTKAASALETCMKRIGGAIRGVLKEVARQHFEGKAVFDLANLLTKEHDLVLGFLNGAGIRHRLRLRCIHEEMKA